MRHTTNFFTFLVLFIASVMFLTMPASAAIVNGDFETGDFYGWNITVGTTPIHVPDLVSTGGDRGLYTPRFYTDAQNKYAAIRQDVTDFSLYDNVSFDMAGYGHGYQTQVVINSTEGTNTIFLTSTSGEETSPWDSYTVNFSYTGSGYIEFRGYSPHVWGYDYFDNIAFNAPLTDTGLSTDYSSIQWDASSYYSDEIGIVSYFIHDDDWLDTSWGYGYTFYLNHKDSSDSEYIKTRLTSESGSKEIQFDESDSYYTAYMSKHWADKPDSFLFPEIILDTESVDIYQRDRIGTLSLNTTSTTTGEEFNITYKYEYTPTAPSITIKRLVDDVWSDDTLKWIGLTDYTAMDEFTIQHSIDQEGKYLIELRDSATVLQTRVINIVFVGLPPEQNITTSFISTDKELYLFGSTIFTSFAIDNVNYSSTSVFMDIYNNDKDILSYHLPVYSQVDSHYIHLTGNKNIDTNWGFFIIPPPKFYSGNNEIRLSKYDIATGDYVSDIVSKSITIDTVTNDGYGITLSDYEIFEGDSVIIHYVVPSATTLKIVRSSTQEIIKTMEVNTSDSFSYIFEDFGIYDIELHSTNYLEVTTQIIVLDIDIADVIEDDEATFGAEFDSMLSSGAFVALLIIIACVGAFGKIGGVVGVFLGMVVGISISFLMGYLPAWILFIMVLALCVVFVSKLINSFGGGE